MQRAVEEYYDRERNDLLRWMGFSIIVLASFALIVPIIMFAPDFILIPFAILSFFMIYYTASSFYAYGISLDTQRVEEAENSLQKRKNKRRARGCRKAKSGASKKRPANG